MDQIKIGKFIAKSRKDSKLTQSDLADKLGVTEKSISNWENGRNMPDLSLFNPICNILNITINELMSGEKLPQEDYQKKLEENIINVMVDEKRKSHKKRRILILLTSLILFMFLILTIIYNIVELNVNYDERLMTCTFENNKLVYQIKGVSVLNTDYIERVIDNNKYLIFHSTINLYNKRHSNWEYRESLAYSVSNKNIPFGFRWEFDEEEKSYNNIFVYYVNEPLRKVSKMSDSEIKKILTDTNKMCSFN